jgi:hypothetical protein
VVAFRDQKGIAQYTPNELRSFSFYDEANAATTLRAVSNPDGSGRAFLKEYMAGTCKVYGMTVKDARGGSYNAGDVSSSFVTTEKKYIQIKNSQFFPLKRSGFRKHMKEVFADCPSIVAGLNSGQYTFHKWQALVKAYNTEYGK